MEQRIILSPRRYDFLTPGYVAARLAGPRDGRRRGDHDLQPSVHLHPDAPLVAAAVLVPLIDRAEGLRVLLTQRTSHLSQHAGQISFPGGREEPEDVDSVAAALREAEEEIGLPGAAVEILGRLDTYVTSTGFRITPVVGLVRPPFPLAPDPGEVAEVFEVPLDFVVDPAHHERHEREWHGTVRHFYVLPFEDRYIWGATAGMLVNLAQLLAPAQPGG